MEAELVQYIITLTVIQDEPCPKIVDSKIEIVPLADPNDERIVLIIKVKGDDRVYRF